MSTRWSLTGFVLMSLSGLLLMAGCPAAEEAATKTPVLGLTAKLVGADIAAEPSNNDVLVTEVLRLVNERRARIGLSELTINPVLTEMAEGYATDMIERGFFSHEDPDGQGPGERAYKTGYVFLEMGENLAAGQESAEQVVAEWMASPEHRDMILGMQWREVGIGIRVGGEYNVYWVLEFGNPP